MTTDGKVQRLQLPPGVPTLEQLAAMSKALTGRDPTPEELQQAQAILQRVADKRAASAQPICLASRRTQSERFVMIADRHDDVGAVPVAKELCAGFTCETHQPLYP